MAESLGGFEVGGLREPMDLARDNFFFNFIILYSAVLIARDKRTIRSHLQTPVECPAMMIKRESSLGGGRESGRFARGKRINGPRLQTSVEGPAMTRKLGRQTDSLQISVEGERTPTDYTLEGKKVRPTFGSRVYI